MLNVYIRAMLCATLIVLTIQSLIFGCTWIFNHIHKEFFSHDSGYSFWVFGAHRIALDHQFFIR